MHPRLFPMTLAAAFCAAGLAAMAGSHDAADYPLRLHVFGFQGHSHFFAGSSQAWDDGDGRGTLYENGTPQAIDFKFKCQERMRGSAGAYETFMARWKKPGQVLELLLAEADHPQSTYTCELKTDLKNGMAYAYDASGRMVIVPSASYRQWMIRYQYDPEHGKMPLAPGAAAKTAP